MRKHDDIHTVRSSRSETGLAGEALDRVTGGSQLIQSTSQLCMAMMRDDQHSAVSLAFGHQQLVVWQQQLQL
jgi:hypothetical protein